MHKLGWTYRHGTVFALRQCLYHNEATGIERTEMCSLNRWRNHTCLCGPAGKLPRLVWGGIGPRTETCVNWGGPIAMVPFLHQGNVYIKRKPRVWRQQKCISLVGGETPLTCVGRHTTPSHGGRYSAENGNLRKLGWTDRHGTMFAPSQCLYQ